MRAGADFYSS
jgi:hypothetical protein